MRFFIAEPAPSITAMLGLTNGLSAALKSVELVTAIPAIDKGAA
jgi:hypothetical protein